MNADKSPQAICRRDGCENEVKQDVSDERVEMPDSSNPSEYCSIECMARDDQIVMVKSDDEEFRDFVEGLRDDE